MQKSYAQRPLALCCVSFFLLLNAVSLAQGTDGLEFSLDTTSNTAPLPKIFKPNIDLSGRGFHRAASWPQTLAAKEVLDVWQKDIGFNGLFRMQYNLWEIHQLDRQRDLQRELLKNYEDVLRKITESGGTVILDIFGTPAGLGKVLDKKSRPWDLRSFKALVKATVRELSCEKRYNIWYEIWDAPDLDSFFLGRKQDYLSLYRAVAEAIKELETETKIHIPLGGPSTSWWFQNFDGNTTITPERSLIYELIKLCYRYRLPLDFIAWHGFSTDPNADAENTIYKKTAVDLIRDWLTYFRFDRNTPLIVDEWNYDRDSNVLAERKEKSYIAASYIPSRLKTMYKAGIDNQVYFCLEDFQNNKEDVVRNMGAFYFDPESQVYKGGPKAIYNVFRMLSSLGNNMYMSTLDDKFVGVIATKAPDRIVMLIYNYIDPELVNSYLSKNISSLNSTGRKVLINLIKSGQIGNIVRHKTSISELRAAKNVKALLKKAQELNDVAETFLASPRKITIEIKNLKDNYLYQRYNVNSSCASGCEYLPSEEQEISTPGPFRQELSLNPYSVHLIVLTKKPKEPEKIVAPEILPPPANATVLEANVTGGAPNTEGGAEKKE